MFPDIWSSLSSFMERYVYRYFSRSDIDSMRGRMQQLKAMYDTQTEQLTNTRVSLELSESGIAAAMGLVAERDSRIATLEAEIARLQAGDTPAHSDAPAIEPEAVVVVQESHTDTVTAVEVVPE